MPEPTGSRAARMDAGAGQPWLAGLGRQDEARNPGPIRNIWKPEESALHQSGNWWWRVSEPRSSGALIRSTAMVEWCFEERRESGRFAPVSALRPWISGRVFRWHAAQIRCYHQQEHSLGTQMGFLEILTLAAALLEHEKRISCRALQRIFDLDDRALEDL